MIVGNDDHLSPTDFARSAYERALEPERLALTDGGHFAPYSTRFPTAAQSAPDWFREHLIRPAANPPALSRTKEVPCPFSLTPSTATSPRSS